MDTPSFYIEDLAKSLKNIYFFYMVNNPNADFQDFKKTYDEMSSVLINRIHDKYCDHVEGMRKEWTQNIN